MSSSKEKVGYVNGKRRRYRVDVLVFDEAGHILASSNDKNKLRKISLPGGGIDEGESVIQAAAREMAEESGWVADTLVQLRMNVPLVYHADINRVDWFSRAGWSEEESFIVVGKDAEFRPTSAYGSEGDGAIFEMLPIQDVINSTKDEANKHPCPRARCLAEFRLIALNYIVDKILPTYKKK